MECVEEKPRTVIVNYPIECKFWLTAVDVWPCKTLIDCIYIDAGYEDLQRHYDKAKGSKEYLTICFRNSDFLPVSIAGQAPATRDSVNGSFVPDGSRQSQPSPNPPGAEIRASCAATSPSFARKRPSQGVLSHREPICRPDQQHFSPFPAVGSTLRLKKGGAKSIADRIIIPQF